MGQVATAWDTVVLRVSRMLKKARATAADPKALICRASQTSVYCGSIEEHCEIFKSVPLS